MTDLIVSVAHDFTMTPGGRYEKDGAFSGETFRQAFILPRIQIALKTGQKVHIDLDGTAGYATSFLEEAFGGLVRSLNLRIGQVLVIETENPIRRLEVERYIADAEAKVR